MGKLYKCRACEGLVAMDAKKCPHCGANSPVIKYQVVQMIVYLSIIGIFVLFHKQIMNFIVWNWKKALF